MILSHFNFTIVPNYALNFLPFTILFSTYASANYVYHFFSVNIFKIYNLLINFGLDLS